MESHAQYTLNVYSIRASIVEIYLNCGQTKTPRGEFLFVHNFVTVFSYTQLLLQQTWQALYLL